MRKLKLLTFFLIIFSIMIPLFNKDNIAISDEKTELPFYAWLSNPIMDTESDIVFYLPIKSGINWAIRGSISFSDNVDAGIFEPGKALPDEYAKQILLNGVSIYEWKRADEVVFGFVNFGTQNHPSIRFYLSGEQSFDEFRLYFPKTLKIKFKSCGEFSIHTRILIVESNNDWFQTPLLESNKFMIFENLP